MKKRILLFLFFLLGGVLVFFACQQESRMAGDRENRGITIEEARSFFEGFITEFEVFPFTTNSGRSSQLEEIIVLPRWDKATEIDLNGIPTIEVPYNTNYSSIRYADDPKNAVPLNQRLNARHSMVIQTHADGEITFYTMVMIGTQEYLTGQRKALKRATLSHLDTFIGEIRFYTMAGEFVAGYLYRNGQCAGTITREAPLPGQEYLVLPLQPVMTRYYITQRVCDTYVTEREVCTMVEVPGASEDYGEPEWKCWTVTDTETYCYDVSVWVDDPVGGGGGSGPGPGPDPEDPHPDPDPDPLPCRDIDNNKANPMMKMNIAPSGGWNFAGGTYGRTREGGTKFHDGVDLAGDVGTPIYAMFDGTVSNKNYVINQPNRDADGTYPNGYDGDSNDAGNRITVTSSINGKQVDLGYWHLEAENAVAINPRTQEIFKPGDTVFSGDIIGYLGISGNAYNVPYPHLHLQCKVNGQSADPAQFLNATININGKSVITPCD